MNVLHHHLEAIEASCLWDLDFSTESLSEVLVNDTVGGSEEGENVLDEVSFVVSELLPILNVGGEIDLLGCPEGCHLVLVHLPDVVILNRKDNESVWVLFQKWFWEHALSLGEVAVLGGLDIDSVLLFHLYKKGLDFRVL